MRTCVLLLVLAAAALPHGRIGAILFGSPLVSRRPWQGRAALWIRMQQMDGTKPIGAPVTDVVAGGPGPSYVTLPRRAAGG